MVKVFADGDEKIFCLQNNGKSTKNICSGRLSSYLHNYNTSGRRATIDSCAKIV